MSADDVSMLPALVAGRLSTAAVSDIRIDLGHRDHVLDPAIRPLGDAVMVADADGAVVVPARLAAEAVGRALDRCRRRTACGRRWRRGAPCAAPTTGSASCERPRIPAGRGHGVRVLPARRAARNDRYLIWLARPAVPG